MSDVPVLVADTSTLVNLASPRVDAAIDVPAEEDPLKNVLVRYDVHVPDTVVGELSEMATGDDFLATVANLVLETTDHLTVHRTDDERTLTAAVDAALLPGGREETRDDQPDAILEGEYGLDAGELDAIALARNLDADLFVTDEIGADTLPTVALLLEGRSWLVSTPQLIGILVAADVLDARLGAELLHYFRDRKGLSEGYIALLEDRYLP